MEETKELRRLSNYDHYLREWDRHENHINNHFKAKEINKFGSVKKVNDNRA